MLQVDVKTESAPDRAGARQRTGSGALHGARSTLGRSPASISDEVMHRRHAGPG